MVMATLMMHWQRGSMHVREDWSGERRRWGSGRRRWRAAHQEVAEERVRIRQPSVVAVVRVSLCLRLPSLLVLASSVIV